MTDTPLDLDYIEHRMASPMVTYRESVEEDMPALVAALRKAEAQVARMSLLTTAELVYVSSGELTARAEKAEAQVAAVLALCAETEGHADTSGHGLVPAVAAWRIRAAVDGAS